MASSLKRTSSALAATRTVVHTAAANLQTVIVNGLVSNISASKATFFVTIEVGTGTTYRTILKDAPVPYGGALELPKMFLAAGDTLNFTASAASALEAYVSYVEKS